MKERIKYIYFWILSTNPRTVDDFYTPRHVAAQNILTQEIEYIEFANLFGWNKE